MFKCNTEELAHNHICRVKARSITYSECVSVALLSNMQTACSLLYCHLWSVCLAVWLYHTFPHYLINGMTVGWGERVEMY